MIKKNLMVIMKVKSMITEIRILLDGINSRFKPAEEKKQSEFKDRSLEII